MLILTRIFLVSKKTKAQPVHEGLVVTRYPMQQAMRSNRSIGNVSIVRFMRVLRSGICRNSKAILADIVSTNIYAGEVLAN